MRCDCMFQRCHAVLYKPSAMADAVSRHRIASDRLPAESSQPTPTDSTTRLLRAAAGFLKRVQSVYELPFS
ncbi:MAG: hypothetical protein J07HR59_01563 [Halorubrum sp. J07HR59]|nr:MAG: hypothetical protein J07HR59_01563 [Halorubrum sp. J07HR59]